MRTKVHSKIIKRDIDQACQRVQEVFELTELDYNNIIYTEGINFLEHYFGTDTQRQISWVKRMSEDKSYGFWNWFLKQWQIRDRDYLQRKRAFRVNTKRNHWLEYHMNHTTSRSFENAFRNWMNKLDKPI